MTTQFGSTVKAIQCDNGKEFDNSSSCTFFLTHGMHLRMSCPYTSSQNGKAERLIRSLNNVVRCLRFQASLPSFYWVEALQTASYLLNILPTKTLRSSTPHATLFGAAPSYDHLRVFGCKCYPNLSATATHKLSPRSTLCVFLGYSAHHKGYRCLDLSSNRVIISRHVTFDESAFRFAERSSSSTPADLEFLDATNTMPAPIGPVHQFLPAGSGDSLPAQPRAAAPPSASPGDTLAGSAALPALPVRAQSTSTPSDAPAQPRAVSTSSAARGPPPGFASLPSCFSYLAAPAASGAACPTSPSYAGVL